MSNFNIKWEKYADPVEQMAEDLQNKLASFNPQQDGYDEDGGFEDSFIPHKPKFLTSFVSSQPPNPIANLFNMWYMHTTFKITQNIADIIVACPGVEIFRCLTPYRAMIAFGKAFYNEGQDGGSVAVLRKNIETAIHKYLCPSTETEEPKDLPRETYNISDLEKLILTLKEQKQEFVIYVLPNAEIELASSDSVDDLLIDKLATFEQASKNIGGKVIKSWV